MTALRQADFDFFIRHDLTAIVQDTLCPADIADTGVKIVPAVGATTPRTVFDRRRAVELANALGAGVTEFPGGHNGNTSHPAAYAERISQLIINT